MLVLIKLLIMMVVFGGVFWIVKLLYPSLEDSATQWQKKRVEKMAPRFEDIFLFIPQKKIILLDTLSPLVTGLLGYILTQNLAIALGAGGIGLIIPMMVLSNLEKQRRKKFGLQLVDALMILSSSLKAGLSLSQSFEVIVEEMPPPISQEFNLLVRQIKMGVSLDEAMSNLKKRMRCDDLDITVSAMTVAKETGGDLTITFTQIANTIQERNKLISRVNALCVQGKLQGAIMSLIPIGFAAFVYQTNPGFFDAFLNDSLGRFLLGYAVVSEILGVFFIKKFSKIEI
ncbi:MAG: hypothetical protein FJZ09_06680 [Candidatus Omnitrophica bacterium]|nr:hypothetical protein [Candidatus Omnitrophota bacterium]